MHFQLTCERDISCPLIGASVLFTHLIKISVTYRTLNFSWVWNGHLCFNSTDKVNWVCVNLIKAYLRSANRSFNKVHRCLIKLFFFRLQIYKANAAVFYLITRTVEIKFKKITFYIDKFSSLLFYLQNLDYLFAIWIWICWSFHKCQWLRTEFQQEPVVFLIIHVCIILINKFFSRGEIVLQT